MGNYWLKLRFWAKFIAFALLVFYLVLFIAENTGKKVSLWFWFGNEPETSMIPLVLWAFGTGVVGTILVQTTFNAVRQLRQMRGRAQAERLERDREDIRAKAAKLRLKRAPEDDDTSAQ